MKQFILLPLVSIFLSVSHAQNVGIGTSAPPAKLTVSGSGSNPSVPSSISTGVFRIAVNSFEGIDFGKASTSPYAGWLQAGFNNLADPLCLQPIGGSVGIGTSTPSVSAALDVSSTTKGFLPPRMDSTARNAIISPVAGLTIYNASINGFQCYNGTAWYSTVHFIGESYGGGIVFYVYDNGQHGLIAAPADQSTSIRWYGGTNTITRAKADGVGAGLKNSAIIIANQGSVDGASFAASLCNEYQVPLGSLSYITYADWYLPSKIELYLLFLQKNVVGTFANAYWTSTEDDINHAYIQDMTFGTAYSLLKNSTAKVRAIRAF